jgi:hypothetical protein
MLTLGRKSILMSVGPPPSDVRPSEAVQITEDSDGAWAAKLEERRLDCASSKFACERSSKPGSTAGKHRATLDLFKADSEKEKDDALLRLFGNRWVSGNASTGTSHGSGHPASR